MATIIRLSDLIETLTVVQRTYGDILVSTVGTDEEFGAPEAQWLTEVSVGAHHNNERKVVLEFGC